MTSDKQILQDALDIIEQNVWLGGTVAPVSWPTTIKNNVCSIIAINRAGGGLGIIRLDKIKNLFCRVNHVRLVKGSHSDSDLIVLWNDAPSRTREEVIQAFKKAIQAAEDK